jgi:arylsulfatase A-like enzyme
MKHILLYLFFITSVLSIQGQGVDKPNVIIFYVDDLGWQDTNLDNHGNPVPWLTPNMDKLALRGAKFSQAYSPAPTCAPSRAAMLSGRHPIKTGVTQVSGGVLPGLKAAKAHNKLIGPFVPHRLQDEEFTIAEALHDAGYISKHVGKWHIAGNNGFPEGIHQGFDTQFDERGVQQGMNDRYTLSEFAGPSNANYPLVDGVPFDSVTDSALSFLEGRVAEGAGAEPFFLYMATWLVHTPIQTRDLELLKTISARLVAAGELDDTLLTAEGIPDIKTPLTSAGNHNPFYGAMVETVDWSLGQLLTYLEDTVDPRSSTGEKLIDTTYIIFSSDNGASEQNSVDSEDEFGTVSKQEEVVADNYPLDLGKTSSREGGIRVPLIITGPGIAQNEFSEIANGLDFFPTILTLTGTTIQQSLLEDLDGADLTPLLKGTGDVDNLDGSDRTDLFWHYPTADDEKIKSSIRRGDYKLYKNYIDGSYEAYQLYNGGDNDVDLNEATDVITTMDQTLKDDMILALESFLTNNNARYPTWNPDYSEPDGPLANQDKVPSVTSTNYDQNSQVITATISTDSGQASITSATLLYLEDEDNEEWFESTVAVTIDGNIITANVPITATKVVFNMVDENNFLVLSDELTTIPGAIVVVNEITLNDSDSVQLFNPATDYSELVGGTSANGNDTYLQMRTVNGGDGAKYSVKSTTDTTIECRKITFGIRSQIDDIVAFDVTIAGVTQSFNYTSLSSSEDIEFDFNTPITFTNTSQEISIVTTALSHPTLTPRFRIYDLTFHVSEVLVDDNVNANSLQYTFPTSEDGSEVLVVTDEVDVLYESLIMNPNTSDPVSAPNTNTFVSSILPDTKNKKMVLGFPTPVFPGANFSFSMKIYSDNPGTNGTGSGRIVIRLYNSTEGLLGDDRLEIIDVNKTGGEWQTISFSSTSLSETTNATITCAGGYDRMLIQATNGAATVERLYFDDLEGVIENPGDGVVAISDTPTLVSENSWIYDNNSSNLNSTVSTFGTGSIIEASATAPAMGIANNKSTTVLKHTRGTTRNAGVTFVGSDFNYLDAKNIKFRVFPECDTDSDPALVLRLRKDGENNNDTELISSTITMIPNQWNEITIDMSAVLPDVAPATDNLYDTIVLFFNTDDEATTSGNFYYIDALQVKTGATNTWNGSTDSTWATGSNWSLGTAPVSTENVVIPTDLTTYPTITTAVSVNNVSIEDDASLVFSGGGTLTTAENVTYKRTIDANKWYLMASPVIGESYDDAWVTDNSIASGQNSNRGISIYDNTSSDGQTGYWRYFQSGGSATAFNSGQGYSILRSVAGSVTFTGSGVYSTTQTITIAKGASKFSLVSNPFTGYLNLESFFADNDTENLLAANSIWVWNAANGAHDTKLSGLHNSYEIAHGQAFFVEVGTLGGADNLTFDINDVTHQGGSDTFQKTSNTNSQINISISDENNTTRNAEIYFIEGATKGYDNGYDGELFGGASHSFALFSELLDDNGKKYQIQSLPTSLMNSAIIPLGLIANTGKNITINAAIENFPSDNYVYLEDRKVGTFTLLNDNGSFNFTTQEVLKGEDRFYIHTSKKSLSTVNETLENVSVYKFNNSILRINGLSQGKANIKLFNTFGKQLMNTSFNSNGAKHQIYLPKLATGIYIIQLKTVSGTLNKKIFLE